jgi:hypothetical protein
MAGIELNGFFMGEPKMKELDFLEALLQEQAERHEREPIGKMTFTLPTTPPTTTPMQEQPTITPTEEQEQLMQEIHYDPETGQFRQMRIIRGVTKPPLRIGTIRPSTGYIQIRVNGVVHQAHRLAWLYMTGVMPDFHIIHIDGVKHDNRWANLERRTGIRVDKKVGSEQASGVMGVTWDKPRNQWRVRTRVNGKSKHVGMFKELNDAIEARENANTRYEQKP